MPVLLNLKIQKGKRVLRGIDHFWSVVMARHRESLGTSIADIFDASNDHESTVRDFVRRLEKAGLLEVVMPAELGRDTVYRPTVVQSRAPRVRRDGTVLESVSGTQCMWNLMRGPTGRAGFTYQDLVDWSGTDETAISVATAKSYIAMLWKAGYLVRIDAGKPGTAATWKLDFSMNTGPQAPKVLRTKLVYDPNRNEVFGEAEAEEVIS